MISVVEDISLVRCVQIVHIYVQVIRSVEQIIFTLIQREADPGC